MITLRCSFCRNLFEVESSMIGTELTCQTCSRKQLVDLESLARFELPSRVVVRVVETDGASWRGKPVVVILHRVARLPPMMTDSSGRLEVGRENFLQAEADAQSEDIMGRKGDSEFVRHIYALVPSKRTGADLAVRRGGSGWPLSKSESSLYGNMNALLHAYAPENAENVKDASGFLDLESGQEEIFVRVSRQGDGRTG
jgi:DNA-directed RNA polymerase subunit RPC12/RpoP